MKINKIILITLSMFMLMMVSSFAYDFSFDNGEDFFISSPCFDSDDNICSLNTTCNISLVSNDYRSVAINSTEMERLDIIYAYDHNGSIESGEYKAVVYCNDPVLGHSGIREMTVYVDYNLIRGAGTCPISSTNTTRTWFNLGLIGVIIVLILLASSMDSQIGNLIGMIGSIILLLLAFSYATCHIIITVIMLIIGGFLAYRFGFRQGKE